MQKLCIYLALLGLILTSLKCSSDPNQKNIVVIKTDFGKIKIRLYNETPQHKKNFLKLVSSGYYDDLLFHRVIKDFMIQGGDPESKNAERGKILGNGGPDYTIPAEFNKNFYHKKGALAAARRGDEVNPEKRSSGSQFYIVSGKIYTDEELTNLEANINQSIKINLLNKLFRAEQEKLLNKNEKYDFQALVEKTKKQVDDELKTKTPFKFSEEQRNVYKTIGGTPFLDGGYTVFGEVIEGLDVLDKIASVKTDENDRPLEDLKIKIKF